MANIGNGAIEGTVQLGVTAVSSNYTIQASDELVQVTTGASNLTITLPAPAAANTGVRVRVQKVDNGAGSATLAGTLNIGNVYKLTSLWSAAELVCDGTRWNLLGTVS